MQSSLVRSFPFVGFFVFLTALLPAQEVLWTHSINTGLGTSCVIADTNADGVADLAHSDVGVLFIRSGADGSVIRSITSPALNSVNTLLFWDVSLLGAGDINADGQQDFAAVNAFNSVVQIISGLDGSVIHQVTSATASVAPSFAAMGDLDQDGFDDFAAGNPAGNGGSGTIELRGGANNAVLLTINTNGMASRIVNAGDINHDGTPDLVVSTGTELHIFSGTSGTLLRVIAHPASSQGSLTLPGVFPLPTGGIQMAAGEDVNGDGTPDIALGFPGSQSGGQNSGEIIVYSGADGTQLLQIVGQPCDGLGFGVALGDFSGDGHADIAIGQQNDLGLPNHVRVFSGATGERMLSTEGLFPSADTAFITGDLDRDGTRDLLVFNLGLLSQGGGYVAALGGGPTLGSVAAGDVQGGGMLPLEVNGSNGGEMHRVDIDKGAPLNFTMAQPNTNPGPVHYGIFGCIGAPDETQPTVVANAGTFCVPPAPLTPTAPDLFTLATTWLDLPGATLIHTNPGALNLSIPQGINTTVTFTLQALVEESPGVLRPTNAIIVRVR